MKKYRINKDEPKKLSKEQIEKHKDFKKLSHAYEKMTKHPVKPLYKNPKVFLALILIALLAWLLSEQYSKKEKNDRKKDNETSYHQKVYTIKFLNCSGFKKECGYESLF